MRLIGSHELHSRRCDNCGYEWVPDPTECPKCEEGPTDNVLDTPYEFHCDRFDVAMEWPLCLRWWLLLNRVNAGCKMIAREALGDDYPTCYAKYENKWVRLVMASRFGDIGITRNLNADNGYFARVTIDQLSEFRSTKP